MNKAKQFSLDLRVALRPKMRKLPVNRPKKALLLPLTEEQKQWQHDQQIVWWSQILCGEA
jgi:hypothetical protein